MGPAGTCRPAPNSKRGIQMTFVVETGAASATGTSYVTVAYADAYHSQMGNTDWPTTPVDDDGTVVAQKEAALNRGTYSIDTLYASFFKSVPTSNTQALQFPRIAFALNLVQYVNSDVIPRQLKDAVCEAALKSINLDELFPDVAEDSRVLEYSKKIEGLEKSMKFSPTIAKNEMLSGFYKIEQILKPLLNTDGFRPSFLSM